MIKDTKKKSFLLVLITIIILAFIIRKDFSSIFNILTKSNLFIVIISISFVIIYYAFKALSMFMISQKYNSKVKYKVFLKQTIITQFFNGITPFATGGQPMQIYMLSKENMPVSKATSTVLMDFMAYQIAIILYCVVTLLFDIKLKIFYGNTIARNLVILGFLINLFVCFFAFIVCFSKKTTEFILKIVSKILFKFHKEKLVEKVSVRVSEFHDGTKMFIKDKKLFIKCIFLNICGLTSFYVIPFFLAYALFGNFNISILISIVCSSYVFLVGAFVPIPGGSGGVEYGFIQFFGVFTKLFSNSELLALLLLWRFVTYYFGLILGGIIFSLKKREGD